MKETILKLLDTQKMSVSEISETLACDNATTFKALVKTLAKLEEKKVIYLTNDGKFYVPKYEKLVGVYRFNDKGFGFVTVPDYNEDFYVQPGKHLTAMSGDDVVIEIVKHADSVKKKAAEVAIVAIEKRKYEQIVCEFFPYTKALQEATGYIGYGIPTDKKIAHLTCFIKPDGLSVVEGTICIVSITQYPTIDNVKSVSGVIVKEVGHKNAPGVDILAILHQYNVPVNFAPETLEHANAIADVITENMLVNREDFRHETIVTIDGEDAKDLDDAISLKMLSNGNFELGVHIADVSYYVTENSPLDKEAFERGTSVYLADRVVPMLPQRLSNGICSLHPEVDRLTQSCIMEVNSSGDVVNYRIVPSVICSKKKMTYDRVNQVLIEHNKNALIEYDAFLPLLKDMRQLHYTLYHKRRKRGAIDFESNEAKIVVDDNGKVCDILLRERGLAERMIESFMLVANETVANHFMQRKTPAIYRVHEQPASDKMQRFFEFLTHFGVLVKGTSDTITSKQLQNVLTQVEDQPYELVVSTLLLRSMKQAKYDAMPLGHFGLATQTYTHFTSPIRRYPDLIVHRLLRELYTSTNTNVDVTQKIEQLEDVAHHSSVMERRAVEAERETLALKKAEYMLDKVGQKFEGIVSSVTRFGVFVELPNTIEGLIHVSKMDDDHYEFVEQQLMLVGKKTGKTIQIGQKLTIVVSRVNVETKEIDFKCYYTNKQKKAMRAKYFKPSHQSDKKLKGHAKKQSDKRSSKRKK